jgi:hypothetical protein
MATIEELRASMKGAQVFGRGTYIGVGLYLLKIARVKFQRTMIQGTAKESMIVEFEVLSSTCPDHAVGSTVSYVEATKNAGWLDRFKAFLTAAAGVDPYGKVSPDVEEEVAQLYCMIRDDDYRTKQGFPDNFLAGTVVACEGTAGKAKSGSPVTNKRWAPAPAAAA